MDWRWTNDPQDEVDDDHARCFAADGARDLEYCSHTFVLTTHTCAPGTALDDGRRPIACWSLHLDCKELGCAWSSGAASLSWRSAPFISASVFSVTARDAGRRMLEAAEGDLAKAGLCQDASAATV
jgi:hypothetical protein